MLLSLPAALALTTQCAPSIAPETLLSIVQVESAFRPLAIGVNGRPRMKVAATNAAEAIAKSKALIAAGRSVDLGLAQINSRNLSWLGLSVEEAFDPCRNLAAAAQVLKAGYHPNAEEQTALRQALSRYNTGDARRGFANGYVGRVERAAEQIIPALRTDAPRTADPKPAAGPVLSERAAWDVFGEASSEVLVPVADTREQMP